MCDTSCQFPEKPFRLQEPGIKCNIGLRIECKFLPQRMDYRQWNADKSRFRTCKRFLQRKPVAVRDKSETR